MEKASEKQRVSLTASSRARAEAHGVQRHLACVPRAAVPSTVNSNGKRACQLCIVLTPEFWRHRPTGSTHPPNDGVRGDPHSVVSKRVFSSGWTGGAVFRLAFPHRENTVVPFCSNAALHITGWSQEMEGEDA